MTGGIGAGKSTVARGLGRRGARVIDADQTARAVVDPAGARGRRVLAEIEALLGSDVRQPDGTLDRARVAALVFADDALRRRYNAIIHPAIMQATAEEIDAHRDGSDVVVHEIPLLTADTPPLPWDYDLIVTVEAGRDERLRRLQQDRGYSAEHASARLQAQGPEEGRTAIADVVMRTDVPRDEMERLIDELWTRIAG